MKTFAFRSLPQWLSSPPKIDRQNAVIYGVVAMQVGEAMGHGVWADRKTLQTMVELGNSKDKGIKGRWGHPGMSENAMGKQVQVAKNFWIDGDKLRHDAHLWKPARKSAAFAQDPLEYLMDVAEADPAGIGESVVIQTETRWALADGREISTNQDESPEGVTWQNNRPISATTPLPVMRPVSFHFVDFVSEGALTPNGLFSTETTLFSGHSSEYAQELFDLVDKWRAAYSVPLDALPNKINDMLERYIASRGEKRMARKQNVAAQQVVENDLYEELQDESLEDEIEEVDEFEEEVETPTQPDLLAQAAAIASELSVGEAANVAFASVEQFTALSEQVKLLSEQIARQGADIERMTGILIKSLEANIQLDRKLKRIEGEPVVTLKVPTANPMEMKFSHPEPKIEQIADPGALTKVDEQPANHRQRVAQEQLKRKRLLQRQSAA